MQRIYKDQPCNVQMIGEERLCIPEEKSIRLFESTFCRFKYWRLYSLENQTKINHILHYHIVPYPVPTLFLSTSPPMYFTAYNTNKDIAAMINTTDGINECCNE